MDPITRLWKRMSWKQVIALYLVVVAFNAACIGGYIVYICSTKRVHDAIADGDIERMNEPVG